MTVSNRQLSILAAVAVAMVAVTIVIYGVECKPPAEFEKGSLLIQGLELDKIGQITIRKEDKTVTLKRKGKGFVVPERGGYPASVKKVNELFIDCLGIRIADKVTASASNHGELGVKTDSKEATVVEFADALESAAIATVEKGKMTGDLARLAEPAPESLCSTEEFISEIAATFEARR